MAEGRADERTDVFLLGATLHHVLTGKPRHLGESALLVLYAAVYVEPFSYPDMAVSLASRLSGYIMGLPAEQVLVSDAFSFGLGGACIAPYHRAGPLLAGVSFAVAILGSIWPVWVDDMFIALTVFIASALLLLRRPARAHPAATLEARERSPG
jgi:hypothetical protein